LVVSLLVSMSPLGSVKLEYASLNYLPA